MMRGLGVLALTFYIVMVAVIDSLPAAFVLAIGIALCVIAGAVMVRSAVRR